ncbi:MAG: hypothetical protein Q8K83_01110 [Methylotenera sp.]|uniref:hypothetical protein n=1 Tax=Methylotenera sp. TaxID=2051956 RepID=UPI00272752C7|nr:hypothetical protein [Methylotenera sp.]MDO9206445.1 hypothetical protein [Methylotenera sp.]MDP1765478.1 hypothetical protein [Methylotenera sp.]
MKKLYYIDYPQEHIEGQMHKYRCVHCKVETTIINGRLEGHLPTCEYRIKLENAGYEVEPLDASENLVSHDADDFD